MLFTFLFPYYVLRWLPIDCETLGVRYRHLSAWQKVLIFANAPLTKFTEHLVRSLATRASQP